MEFETTNFFLVRSPLYSKEYLSQIFDNNEFKENILRKFLVDPVFIEAILTSSIDFYKILEKKEFDINKLSNSEYSTFVKYVIRSINRATPFGLFSSVSSGFFCENLKLNETRGIKKKCRPDMQWIYHLVTMLSNELSSVFALKVKFNPMALIQGDRLYLDKKPSTVTNSDEKNQFLSIRYSKQVEAVQSDSQEYIEMSLLLTKILERNPKVNKSQIEEFLLNLYKNGFLISNLHPSMSNYEQLAQIISELQSTGLISDTVEELVEIQKKITIYSETAAGEGILLYKEIVSKMSNLCSAEKYLHLDTSLESVSFSLDMADKNEVDLLGNFLFKMTQIIDADDELLDFKTEFLNKYGYFTMVPLNELLNENEGLGAPTHYRDSQNFKPMKKEISFQSENIQRLIKQKIIQNIKLGEDTCVLLDNDFFYENQLFKKGREGGNESFELNLKVIKSMNSDMMFAVGPNIGSDQAGRMFGRFAHILGKELDEIVDKKVNKMNSDTVLAEVFEVADQPNLSNVCVTRNKTPYEITIFNSLSWEKDNILINDIYVTIDKNNQFLLYSKQLNKQIDLNISNMLNPQLESKYIRFLKDVALKQKPSIFDVYDLLEFEDLIYVPRIVYSKTILKPASWKISFRNLGFFKKQEEITKSQFIEKFKLWKSEWNIPDFAYLCKFDQKLYINTDMDVFIEEIYKELKKTQFSDFILLTEIEDKLFITDSESSRYFHEIVVPLFPKTSTSKISHKTSSYLLENTLQNSYKKIKKSYFFGDDGWFYFKLRTIEHREKELINELVTPNMVNLYRAGLINKYFFIRYFEDGKVIRLRIQAKDKKSLSILHVILDELKKWIKMGVIKDYSIATYEPEVQRYGGESLQENVEDFFFWDSLFVDYLLKYTSSIQRNNYAIVFTKNMSETMNCNTHLSEELHGKYYFRNEYRRDRKKLMQLCIDSEKGFLDFFNEEGREIFFNRKKSLEEYWKKVEILDGQKKLLNSKDDIAKSIIHMFHNRLNGDRHVENELMTKLNYVTEDINSYLKYNT